MRRILVIDTSILCVWLEVPGKETCGPAHDRWNKDRVDRIIAAEEKQGTLFVLPLASLIETGNHIAQTNCKNRFELAQKLSNILLQALNAQSPWAAFSNLLCEKENLRALANKWPEFAAKKISIGDATITQVAENYAQMGMSVEILTGDLGLKSYQPATPSLIPRRRKT